MNYLTTDINPCEHNFVSKMQTLIHININEFYNSKDVVYTDAIKILLNITDCTLALTGTSTLLLLMLDSLIAKKKI